MVYAALKDLKNFYDKIDPYIGELVNPENFSLSRDTIRRQRKSALDFTPAIIRELTKSLIASMWCYDCKAVKDVVEEKSKQTTSKEMFSLSTTGKTDLDDFEIVVSPTETSTDKSKESDKSAAALLKTLQKGLNSIWTDNYKDDLCLYKQKIFGFVFDTTSTNTGWRGGFNPLVERELDSGSKLNIPCRNHIIDTANKYMFRHPDIDGETKGGNSGGPLTSVFNDVKEWLRTADNWDRFRSYFLFYSKKTTESFNVKQFYLNFFIS